MVNEPKSTQNGTTEEPPKHCERIRACSIALSSGSSRLGNLEWSELGQALVVTDDAIVVLSPLTGLHPTLAGQSRMQDVECHPNWNDRFPHSVAQINIKTFLEHDSSLRRRTLLESDHSSTDPRFLSVQWCSASWSKPGMGPHGSCLILAITSELDLFILGAPLNAWTGEWKLFYAVNFDPVASSVDLDAAQAAQGDNEVFTRSRALLRKKQMATEVSCASWIHQTPQNQTTASESPPGSDSFFTYIIAGTRSGHLGIWKCAAISGRCTFLSATSVSSTGIEQLVVSTYTPERGSEAQARIAFKDADGVRLCDLLLAEGGAHLQPSKLAPISSDHCMITAWLWHEHQLIYSTIGRIHVYDTRTEQTATFSLGTEPDSDSDPFSPTICISHSSDPHNSINVTQQDLRKYRIFLDQADLSPVLPIYPSTLTGYPPLTESLQRKYDLHQAFLGYAADPSSTFAAACIIGAVRTNERVAFLGYNVSENICYQMEVVRYGVIIPASILEEALARVATAAPPPILVRTILTLLYTSEQRETLRKELVSATHKRWTALMDGSDVKGGQVRQTATEQRSRQQQLLYLLACRLQDTAPEAPTPFDSLKKTYRESVLQRWLHDQGASAVTEDHCAACQTQLTLSGDESQQDFGWARCQNGHVWPRCSVSLATISDREVRVCTGCWVKAIVPGKPGQSPEQTLQLESATHCLYCGSCWIVR